MKYDRVYWWNGGSERGKWMETSVQTGETVHDLVKRIRHQGFIAIPGMSTIGAPEGFPRPEAFAEKEVYLRASWASRGLDMKADVKPGTRCMSALHGHLLDEAIAEYNEITNDNLRIGGTSTGEDVLLVTRNVKSFDHAVRLVTVPASRVRISDELIALASLDCTDESYTVPMCAACAEYHERNAM